MPSDKLIGKTLVNGFVIEKLRTPAGRNPTGWLSRPVASAGLLNQLFIAWLAAPRDPRRETRSAIRRAPIPARVWPAR